MEKHTHTHTLTYTFRFILGESIISIRVKGFLLRMNNYPGCVNLFSYVGVISLLAALLFHLAARIQTRPQPPQ